MLRSFSFSRECAVVFGARALLGLGFDVEREGDLPQGCECPDPDADCECDVRDAGRDELLAVEAEGDRAGRLAAHGCDTDEDGVFDCRDGGGLRRLASSDARRLQPG